MSIRSAILLPVAILKGSPLRRNYLLVPIVLMLSCLTIEFGAQIGGEMLWFEEVGYLPIYLLRLQTQGLLGIGVFSLTVVYLSGNIALAQRLKSPYPLSLDRQQSARNRLKIDSQSQQISAGLKLGWLLPIVISLSLSIGIILVHYLQVGLSQWQIDPNLPSITPPAPP